MAIWALLVDWASGLFTWFRKSPVGRFVGWALLALGAFAAAMMAWGETKRRIKSSGVREERARQAQREDRAAAELAVERQELSQGRAEDAARADAAVVDMPVVHSADELRRLDPEAADLVLGPRSRPR